MIFRGFFDSSRKFETVAFVQCADHALVLSLVCGIVEPQNEVLHFVYCGDLDGPFVANVHVTASIKAVYHALIGLAASREAVFWRGFDATALLFRLRVFAQLWYTQVSAYMAKDPE